jgi:hypothetical protein
VRIAGIALALAMRNAAYGQTFHDAAGPKLIEVTGAVDAFTIKGVDSTGTLGEVRVTVTSRGLICPRCGLGAYALVFADGWGCRRCSGAKHRIKYRPSLVRDFGTQPPRLQAPRRDASEFVQQLCSSANSGTVTPVMATRVLEVQAAGAVPRHLRGFAGPAMAS